VTELDLRRFLVIDGRPSHGDLTVVVMYGEERVIMIGAFRWMDAGMAGGTTVLSAVTGTRPETLAARAVGNAGAIGRTLDFVITVEIETIAHGSAQRGQMGDVQITIGRVRAGGALAVEAGARIGEGLQDADMSIWNFSPG
jgi:hypothetical protein